MKLITEKVHLDNKNISFEYLNSFNTSAKIYSFDIFDTVITRATVTPLGIFVLMQNKLMNKELTLAIPDSLAKRFASVRIEAEKVTRKRADKEEVGIAEIYNVVAEQYCLSAETTVDLIKLEIATELYFVRPVPKMLELLKFLKSKNKRIIFSSDMYLSSDMIQKMLKKVGICVKRNALYVSNELGLTKKTGNLYRHILKSENCLPKQMIHIGDNFETDIAVPGRLGIRCIHFTDTLLNRYENALLVKYDEQSSTASNIFQITSGASRLGRFASYNKSDHFHILNEIGSCVAGPILVGYVLWILKKAKDGGIKRLYFIARDGQILLKIAKKINSFFKFDIQLSYLYGSRQAWYLPSTTKIDEELFSWLFKKDQVITLEMIAERINIEIELLQSYISNYFKKNISKEKNLNSQEIDDLRSLISTTSLASLILQSARVARHAVAAYLKQEGLFDNTCSGIVDIGWNGNLQHSLRKLLKASGLAHKIIYGFYFGLFQFKSEDVCDESFSYFFNTDDKNIFRLTGYGFVSLLELFTAADHGIVLSYKKDINGIWCSKLKSAINNDALSWGLEELRDAIFEFMKNLPIEFLKDINTQSNMYKQYIMQLMKMLSDNPTKEEAVAIGSCCMSSDQTETKTRVLAPEISAVKALICAFTKHWHNKIYSAYWLEGSRARSGFLSSLFLSWRMQKVLGSVGLACYKLLGYSKLNIAKDINTEKIRNILFFESSSGFGGSANSLVNLVKYIDRKKFRPIIAIKKNGSKIDKIKNIELIQLRESEEPINLSPFKFITYFVKYLIPELISVYSIIKRKGVSLVHINNNIISASAVIIASRIAHVPCVCHVRQTRDLTKREKIFAKWVDRFIVLNKDVYRKFKMFIPESKLSIIYDGIDLMEFDGIKGGSFKNEFNLDSSPMIGIVGRIVEGKGHKEFLLVAKDVIKKKPNAKFVIVGDGISGNGRYCKEVKEMVKKENIEENIIFTGWRNDLGKIMIDFDLILHPYTLPEGFPNTLIEAMLLEKSVISTDISGPAEIVVNEKTGFLVSKGDKKDMARRILYLLDNPQVAREMGGRGRKRIEQYCDIRKNVKSIECVYERLLSRA